jgi:hypothetical protein
MTHDSKDFKPREWWEAKGYKPDVFGRWIDGEGNMALPLYEGRMIGQFDFSQKGYVSGRGRSAVWRELPFDSKTIEPQYLMASDVYRSSAEISHGVKLAFMDIASSTNARTMIAVVSDDLPFGNSAPVLTLPRNDLVKSLLLSAALNSLPFDFATRQRVGGLHLNWFIVEECPAPHLSGDSRAIERLVLNAARLTFTHRRFAPLWLHLKQRFPTLAKTQWKKWWAVTEVERMRLQLEVNALCADLYGFDPEDFDWIVEDNPNDPKGFHRVDKHLPFRERLTGLAATAFRALKDGKWSAESAATLSNDEFFDILGIPELTSADAAQAKGLPGPLILKRDGCHEWHPERFPESDARHGWTWEHCRQDAVTLLGSEDAVEKYIAGDIHPSSGSDANDGHATDGEPFQLRSDPPKPKQGKMF